MAQVSLLKRVSSYLQNINESTDQPLVSTLEGTLATRSLWADAAATTVNLGTGTALTTLNVGTGNAVSTVAIATGTGVTAINIGTGTGATDTITIGGTGSETVIQGDLTVNGTTTTINSTTLDVADRFITCAVGGGGNISGGLAVSEANGAGNDLLFMWNDTGGRAEIGFGDASTNPANVASFANTKVNNLLLGGTAVTADAGLTVTATAASLTLAATGANTVAFSTNALSRAFFASDGGQEYVGLAANPSLSAAGNGRIYYNSTSNEWRVSNNGGAYTAITLGTPTLSAVLSSGNTTGTNNIVISSGQALQSASGSDLTLESQGATEQITLRTNATDQWAVDENGHLMSLTASNNIGNAAQTLSPQTVYAAVSVVVGTTTTLTTNSLTGSGALTVSATAAALTLQTTTSGTLNVTSAGILNMTAASTAVLSATSTVFIDSTGAGFSIDGVGASNVSTTAANLTLSTITSGTLFVTSAGTLDVDGVTVQVDAGAGGFSIDGAAASNVSTTAANLTVSTITSGTLAITSAAILDLDGTSVTVDATGAFSIDGAAASNVSTTAANLTVSTITSGTLAVTSAGILDLDGSSATLDTSTSITLSAGTNISLVATTSLAISAVVGALTIDASTAGVSIDAAAASNFTVSGATADLTLGARAATITLNESGQTTLTGFTATSIVGALNELMAASGPADQVNVAYTNANAGTITLGQAVYISTTDSVDLAVATSDVAAARVVGFVTPVAGIATTASGDITTEGRADARFVAGLTLSPGDEVYLSLTAGSVTDDISAFTTGNVIQSVGFVKSLTPINGGTPYNGGGALVAQIQVQWGGKIVL